MHTARQWFARNADARRKVVLKVDFKSIFNCVKRDVFLRAFRRHLPGLSAWAEWTYGAPSHLFFAGAEMLASEAGGQQGDPLAPLAFSLALNEILPDVAAAGADGPGELDQLFAYLDDGWIAGDDVAVARAFATLQRLAPSLGLALSVGKCELVPAAGADSAVDRGLFPAELAFAADGHFELLGAPVGSASFCAAHTAARVAAAQPLLDELALLPDRGGDALLELALRVVRYLIAQAGGVLAQHALLLGDLAEVGLQFAQLLEVLLEALQALAPSTTQQPPRPPSGFS